jgi:hypothetical protein
MMEISNGDNFCHNRLSTEIQFQFQKQVQPLEGNEREREDKVPYYKSNVMAKVCHGFHQKET